jgi:putrescine transport system substrate-binding protein
MSFSRQIWTVFVIFAGLSFACAVQANGDDEDDEKVLNIYNFASYIGPDTIANFERETHIKVHYDVYVSNQDLETKLFTGKSGYDVVVPSMAPYLERQVIAGVLGKLDKKLLPNFSNLDPALLEKAQVVDPGNQYGMPYMWGTTAIGYNPDMVKKALGDHAPTDSLALLFDPENAKRLASCGISLLDDPPKVFGAALAYLGLDPTSHDPKDLERAVDVVKAIMPYVRKITQTLYMDELANGELCVSYGHNGDVIIARNNAREAKNGINLVYMIPKEGALVWIDAMAIPRDAPHPKNAHKFLNFILRPEVVAEISNAVTYANTNKKANSLVQESLRNDPAVYPNEETMKHVYVDKLPPASYEKLRNRAWTRIRAGLIR